LKNINLTKTERHIKNLCTRRINKGQVLDKSIVMSEINPINYLTGTQEITIDIIDNLVRQWPTLEDEEKVYVLKLFTWNLPMLCDQAQDHLRLMSEQLNTIKHTSSIVAAFMVLAMEHHNMHDYLIEQWYSRSKEERHVKSALRSVELDKRLGMLLEEDGGNNFHSRLEEYEGDLEWFNEDTEPTFSAPSYHRLLSASMCMALEKIQIPVEFFEGLTDLQSTGYAEGFILAQLYWCQEKYTESKEMLQSLLSYFGSSLPESPPTHDLWNQIDSEFGTRLGRFNPRKLPWAESRSKRYWQLVLDMEA
jgi:hypothetical protein